MQRERDKKQRAEDKKKRKLERKLALQNATVSDSVGESDSTDAEASDDESQDIVSPDATV